MVSIQLEDDEYNSLEVGTVLFLYYGPDNLSNATYHVRGRVDNKLVLRVWSKHKKRWNYLVEGIEWFVVFRSCIRIAPPKKKDDQVL